MVLSGRATLRHNGGKGATVKRNRKGCAEVHCGSAFLKAQLKDLTSSKLLDDHDVIRLSVGCTVKHDDHRDEVTDDFLSCLKSYPNKKWDKFLLLVDFMDSSGRTVQVPSILASLGGPVTNVKIAIANKALIDWQIATRKKKVTADAPFPWYQPVTQNQRLRTFFGLMAKEYEWQLNIDHFRHKYMVCAVLSQLYSKRRSRYVQFGYGEKNKKRRLCEVDVEKVRMLSEFDEADPRQHIMKILFGCGALFGFRGHKEHAELLLSNVRRGFFEKGHPWEGYEWVGFGGLEDKTNVLSFDNTHLRDETGYLRVPVVFGDANNLGSCIVRYLEKVGPAQERFYCYPLAEVSLKKSKLKLGMEKVVFAHNKPVGHNNVAKFFKEGATILGLSNPECFYPHSLRAMFITDLANHEGVNLEETMRSARHKSAASSAVYQSRSGASEAAKFDALGVTKGGECLPFLCGITNC